MKVRIIHHLISSLVVELFFSSLAAEVTPVIIPAPKFMRSEQGSIELPRQIYSTPVFENQARALGAALGKLTGQTFTANSGKNEEATITLQQVEGLSAEEYHLDSQNGLTLKASTPAGVARATATLLQLVNKSAKAWRLPKVTVADRPDFAFRCFLLDMGRNPHSPETLRRVIDMLWLAKASYLHLHLTDDQLISFPSTTYPRLLSKKAGWNLNDWHEMEKYSQARGVTLIPELDVPGHSGLLRHHYPEVFGKTPTELASLDSAYHGVTTILSEMMEVFEATPYIHVGGDEAYGVDEKIQRSFINRLNEFVKGEGRGTLVWEGPRAGKGENKVAEDVIHMNWRAREFPPAEMIAAGHVIINATWDPLYVVDHYPRTMFTAVPSLNCYEFEINKFKHVDDDFTSYSKPIRIDSTENVLGFCMPWWEGREENLFPICRQRITAVTARTWNDDGENSFDSFLKRDAKLKVLLEKIRPWKGKAPAGGWANRMEKAKPGNLAHGKKVTVSTGASQPQFHPQRLTNGATDRFDHFLGYPTKPEALEIVIDLGEIKKIGHVQIFEAAVGKSWENYEVLTSKDQKTYENIGRTTKESRGEGNSVTFKFVPKEARYISIQTQGCENLTFPSFSRLCEVMAFEE